MKKILVALLLLPLVSFAQEDYKEIAQKTCECIQKKDMSAATKNKLKLRLGYACLK
ncbi:MAG: hypothetical protein UZ12_BCD005000652 [Bacteroidetes bacterium OLB12]|nr:MAG: hypothetical protein UZ12_BCD005000652 [Bacteroidetes bacterium OLB12]